MSVFRVHKTCNYTVMSNYHLKDKRLSLKAKGLMSVMLSLPDDWKYSMSGLTSICKEGPSAVKAAIDELTACGYVKITKHFPNQTKTGRIEYSYDVFENPQDMGSQLVDEQPLENQMVENQVVENHEQLSTNDQSTNDKVLNIKYIRHRYGEYGNVLLSDADLAKLKEEFPDSWQDWIEKLSSYMASSGRSYKNYLATIRNWARKESPKPAKDETQEWAWASYID